MATAIAPVKDVLTTDDELTPAEPLPAHFSPRNWFAIYPEPHIHAISIDYLQGHKAFKAAKLSGVPLAAPYVAVDMIPLPLPHLKLMLDGDVKWISFDVT